jgi:hypothetical protein
MCVCNRRGVGAWSVFIREQGVEGVKGWEAETVSGYWDAKGVYVCSPVSQYLPEIQTSNVTKYKNTQTNKSNNKTKQKVAQVWEKGFCRFHGNCSSKSIFRYKLFCVSLRKIILY